MISIVNIGKYYKNKSYVFKNITFKIPSPSFCLIVGKSGTGKTTLLNILGGLDAPNSGEVLYDDTIITKKNVDSIRNTKIGFIFQQMNLISSLSLKDNLKFSFDLCNEKMTEKNICEILKSVGLPDSGTSIEEFLKRKPYELSVGQMQRFSIARALIKNPEILIMDEPTSSLDEENAKEIVFLLKRLSLTKCIIVSSHQKDLFCDFVDQIIEIKGGKANVLKGNCEVSKESENKIGVLKKGFLSFKNALKFSLINLKNKKIRLITSFILSTVTAILFSIAFLFQTCDTNKVLLQTQFSNNEYGAFITNVLSYNDHDTYFKKNKSIPFSDNQLFAIDEYTNGYACPAVDVRGKEEEQVSDIISHKYYTTYGSYSLKISNNGVEIDSKNAKEVAGLIPCPYLSKDTQNRFPENYNEIAINSLTAELILKYGLVEVKETSTNKEQVFYPQKIDDIIGKNTCLGYTIVGIFSAIDGSDEFYRPYLFNEPTFQNKNDYEYYNNMKNGDSISQYIYLKPGFSKHNQISGEQFKNPNTFYIKLHGKVKSDYNFLKALSISKENYVSLSNRYTGCTYLINVFSGYFMLISWAIIGILIFISLIISLNLFYANIKTMEKDLGILKAMGASKLCLALLVTIQSIIVSVVELILSLTALGIIIALINSQIRITLFVITPLSFFSLFALFVLTAIVVSILSSKKLLLEQPINVIEGK